MKPIASIFALVLTASTATAHEGIHVVPHDGISWVAVAAGLATIAAAMVIGWAKR